METDVKHIIFDILTFLGNKKRYSSLRKALECNHVVQPLCTRKRAFYSFFLPASNKLYLDLYFKIEKTQYYNYYKVD